MPFLVLLSTKISFVGHLDWNKILTQSYGASRELTCDIEIETDMPHWPPTLVALPFWGEGTIPDVVELEQVEAGGVHDGGEQRHHKADNKVQP